MSEHEPLLIWLSLFTPLDSLEHFISSGDFARVLSLIGPTVRVATRLPVC